jgi:Na+/H+-translocating membrane pyrophosphatase
MRDVTVLILYPVFCCVGIVTNGICILVLTRKKKRSPTHHFLLGLTISELIHVLNDLLYFVSMFVSLFDGHISHFLEKQIIVASGRRRIKHGVEIHLNTSFEI